MKLVHIKSLIITIFFTQGFLISQVNAQSAAESKPPIDEIIWAINPAPPFHIFQDPYAQNGVCDVLVDVVQDKLTAVKHSQQIMPHARISNLLEQNKNMCFPCMIYKPLDETKAVYTRPTHFYRPHGIITNQRIGAELKERFGEPLSLEAVFNSGDYRFGQPSGRQYGDLQAMVRAYTDKAPRHVQISGDSNNVSLLSMIYSERLDFTIDYRMMKRYFEMTQNESLMFIEIAENQNQSVLGSIGCTSNAWGRAAVAEINRVIDDVRADPEFRDALKLWFDDEEKEDYQLQFEREVSAKYDE